MFKMWGIEFGQFKAAHFIKDFCRSKSSTTSAWHERNSAQRPNEVLRYAACPWWFCQLNSIRALQVYRVRQDAGHRWTEIDGGREGGRLQVKDCWEERGEKPWQTTLEPASLLDCVESEQRPCSKREWVYDRARDDAGNCSWKLIHPAHVERGRAALSQGLSIGSSLPPAAACHTVCAF